MILSNESTGLILAIKSVTNLITPKITHIGVLFHYYLVKVFRSFEVSNTCRKLDHQKINTQIATTLYLEQNDLVAQSVSTYNKEGICPSY